MRLQILFVDRSDTVRARVAAGLLERIAEWNGYGRALYPLACGVDAAQVSTDVATLCFSMILPEPCCIAFLQLERCSPLEAVSWYLSPCCHKHNMLTQTDAIPACFLERLA